MGMTDIGAERLVIAIAKQAAADYKAALRKYNITHDYIKKSRARHTVLECERYFHEEINNYLSVSGEKIISKIQGEVREELAKKGISMEVPESDSTGII